MIKQRHRPGGRTRPESRPVTSWWPARLPVKGISAWIAGSAGTGERSELYMENTKNKQEIIEELKAIIKANEKNIYCDEYQLGDMIKNLFKDYDVHF